MFKMTTIYNLTNKVVNGW